MTIATRILSEFSRIDAAEWERLDHHDNPFVSHAFLGALESSGALDARLGWTPCHLALYEGDELVAFAPSYVKSNSHGEFVFDWAWADAYQRHGLSYYPKLLTAVPYSPVTGPRLLTRRGHPDPAGLRRRLVRLAVDTCAQLQLSSWHCNFVAAEDRAALEEADLLPRQDWQFHWVNEGYSGFDGFLERLRARKRKNVLRERRQVEEAGIRFRWLRGRELGDPELEFVQRCYGETFRQYGNHAALNREFFARLAATLGDGLCVAIALRDQRPLAMSLYLQGGGRLYGRYWGCLEQVPGLHFETAYYQGIEFCIANGIGVFESGAQGEHKISRGFRPAATHSFHYLREAAFREPIARYLRQEKVWMLEYREQLAQHDPFRHDPFRQDPLRSESA
ncbi:MAG: GNAT family N-acetyltransferase [Xanthomonadales bacterium]|nr:GNAT family N-acetyltransferase [Xanthomonadales bacterium]